MDEQVTLNRRACLAALDSILRQYNAASEVAVFVLDGGFSPEELAAAPCGDLMEWRQYELALEEAVQQIWAAAPACHHVLRIEGDRLVVIASGIADGAAVLGVAARLVHLLEDSLNGADVDSSHRASVGIALSSAARSEAQALLLAAESGLAASVQSRRLEGAGWKRRVIRRHTNRRSQPRA
jgi:predicted signal transduction protein with EAL and GGDEF domain